MTLLNMEIPGWLTETPLRVAADYAGKVPVGGTILELGAYLGRTTWALAKNARSDANIHVVDLWVDQSAEEIEYLKDYNRKMLSYSDQFYEIDRLMASNNGVFSGDDFHKLWNWNVREFSNIKHYRENTQTISTDRFGDIDFIFMDASHDHDGTLAELNRWWPKLRTGGTILIDDYNSWPGVQSAVNEFFQHSKQNLILTNFNIVVINKQ